MISDVVRWAFRQALPRDEKRWHTANHALTQDWEHGCFYFWPKGDPAPFVSSSAEVIKSFGKNYSHRKTVLISRVFRGGVCSVISYKKGKVIYRVEDSFWESFPERMMKNN